MMTDALSVAGLSKSFGQIKVLSDVTFTVPVGQRRAVIGPNGAGKTTLFNTISGFIPPNAGRIAVLGEDVTGMSAHQRVRRGLGRTFQVTSLFPTLTVRDNLLLALVRKEGRFSLRPLPWRRDLIGKADGLIEEWGLAAFASTRVSECSYGIQRQLEIMLAVVQEPAVLMLDEPSSGLSAADRDNLVRIIRGLGDKVTILMIEHDISLAFSVADYVTVLSYGAMMMEGTPQQVQDDPRVAEIYFGSKADAQRH